MPFVGKTLRIVPCGGLVLWITATAVFAQEGSRPANARWQPQLPKITYLTAHYALGGTVSPERLAEYGQCLEYIYSDFTTGFPSMVAGYRERADDEGHRPEPMLHIPRPHRRTDGKLTGSVFVGDRPVESNKHALAAGDDKIEDELDGRFRVIVFDSRVKFRAVVNFYHDGPTEHPYCAHLPALDLLVVYDRGGDIAYGRLFHHAFHQFIHRYAPYAPTWIDEGLASYYGTARVVEGSLLFARRT